MYRNIYKVFPTGLQTYRLRGKRLKRIEAEIRKISPFKKQEFKNYTLYTTKIGFVVVV